MSDFLLRPIQAPTPTGGIDGVANRLIFCMWTGDETLSDARLTALWSIMRNTGGAVAFLTRDTLHDWVKPSHPLHPAWPYLSSTHKSDYLRCYLMHHYGGGYTDIKVTSQRWRPFFDQLAASAEGWALGYQELAHGIPHMQGEFGDLLRRSHKELIGLCAFIFKRGTPLTKIWLERTERLLDKKLPLLQQHPACHPLDRTGILLPDGRPSPYPLGWSEMLGEIFHPLTYEHRQRLLQADIAPSFAGYR